MMRKTYWGGVGFGVVSSVAIVFLLLNSRDVSSQQSTQPLVIDPPFVGLSEPWILPGRSREFTVQLRNCSDSKANIKSLQFSCPCSTGTIAGIQGAPVVIADGETVPIHVMVTSRNGENGPVDLRFRVVGQIEGQLLSIGGSASLRFVQHLNSDTPLLALGRIDPAGGKLTKTVELWFPFDGEAPRLDATVETDDPCVSSVLERLPVPHEVLDGTNRKVIFARAIITVDPKIAPEKMKVHVIVRSGQNELRIPVYGFVEGSSDSESSQ